MSTSVRRPSAWRLQQQQRGEGRYYTLIRGTGSDRVSLSLGLRSGEAARRFLLAMD